jgi:hypothetical protein
VLRALSAPKSGSGFLGLWWTDGARDCFLAQLPREDLASFRRVCHDFSVRAAPALFGDMTITFRASTFTRPARMVALERIGRHVRTLTFHMPHTAETFLPPLIDPVTGEERVFVYVPQTSGLSSSSSSGGGNAGSASGSNNSSNSSLSGTGSGASGSSGNSAGGATTTTIGSTPPSPPQHKPAFAAAGPKYGSWAMTDLLTKQYGPLFHAATNVTAFVRAFSAMPDIEHLRISCPDQNPCERYRRSAVDYALISVRMAVERAPLTRLAALSLVPVHAGALLYLHPGSVGFGASPRAPRRWAQIRRLTVQMDSWAFDAPLSPPSPSSAASRASGACGDHLKLLHQYLLALSPRLQRLSFRWRGAKGPCPFTLDTEPALRRQTLSVLATPLSPAPSPPAIMVAAAAAAAAAAAGPNAQDTGEHVNVMAPAAAAAATATVAAATAKPRRLRLAALEHAALSNAAPHAAQLNRFIHRHRRSLLECDFDGVELRSGNWDEALDVLTRISGSDRWKREQVESPRRVLEPSSSFSSFSSSSSDLA